LKKLACLLLLIFIITGCGPRKTYKTTIVVGLQTDVYTRNAYTHAKERFERDHPGVGVQELAVTGRDYYQKMQTMFAGSSEPDVMWLGMGFGDFAAKGVLEDLAPFLKKEPKGFYENLNTKALNAYKRPEGQFGLPFGIDFQILYFNRDLFDKAGLSYPNSNWTKEDVLNAARKLTIYEPGGKRPKIYGLVGGFHLIGFGGRIVSDDGKRSTVNSPEMVNYLNYTRDLYEKYKVSPKGGAEQLVGMSDVMMFASGRAAMAVLANYDLPALLKGTRCKWDMCAMPYMGGKEHRLWGSTAGYCMSKRSKNKQLAWELIKEYISPAFMKEYYPATIPSDEECAKQMVGNDKRLPPGALKTISESMVYVYIPPRIKSIFEVENIFSTSAEKFWINEQTAEEVLKEADTKITKVLKPGD